MRTRIVSTGWRKVGARPGAALMLRLAMAVNDLVSAEYVSRRVHPESAPTEHISRGLTVYGMRMLAGHLHEARKLITDACNNAELCDYVRRLSPDVIERMTELQNTWETAAVAQQFRTYVSGLRDKYAFHYEDKLTRRALRELAHADRQQAVGITLPDSGMPLCGRLVLADTVMLHALTHGVWGIAEGSTDDLERGISDALEWMGDRVREFYAVAWELCVVYFSSCPASV